MPPTQDAVLIRSAIFAPGRTFRNYLVHLKKGRMPAGTNLYWYTPAVRTASGGLTNAKRGHFGPPPQLTTQQGHFYDHPYTWIGKDAPATNFHRVPIFP